jgi:membrane associated rhomboid family serine protease
MSGKYFNRLRSGDTLVQLISINVILFITVQIYLVTYYVSGKPLSPEWGEDLKLAANSSLAIMKERPWSLITHMFAHIHTGHFLFNMIALYSMGKIFISIERPSSLWKLYLLGGTIGYLLFAFSFHFSDVLNAGRDHAILGASAAVMAIVVATAVMQPRRIVFLFGAVRLELAWLAIILIVLDLASIRQGVNSGGHIGHIGGGILGFFYGLKLFDRGSHSSLLESWKRKIQALFRPSAMSVVHRRPKTDDEFNTERADKQKKIDLILDKIGQSGYESLTQAEKDFLFKHSQK